MAREYSVNCTLGLFTDHTNSAILDKSYIQRGQLDDRLKQEILGIYDAASDAALWPGVLDRLADRLNAHGCIMFEWAGYGSADPQRKLLASHISARHKREVLEGYLEKCAAEEMRDQDVFEAHSLRSDTIDLIDDSVLAPNLNELKGLRNVEILQKFGILHRAAGLLNKDNTAQFRFSVQLAAHRGALTPPEQSYLRLVLPHMAKAMDLGRIAQDLAHQHATLLDAMDRVGTGVCLLDHAGHIVAQNLEFSRQIETHSALSQTRDGKLRLGGSSEMLKMAQLMKSAANHGKFGGRPRKEALPVGPNGFLCIELSPLHSSAEMGNKPFDGFLLFSQDTTLPLRFNAQALQSAFGLTDAEMIAAELMADGLTNNQIAEQRERSVSTINAQVKSILSKTDCATRTQFVRLLVSFGGSYRDNSALQ